MQKKQSKNLRKNTDKTRKMWQGRNKKREYLREENYQGDLWQENYSDGQTKDMTKNTGEDWRKIGDGGKEDNQERKR